MTDGRQPAVNGTETRLDLLIDEITALRALLTPADVPEPKDGETVELREPAPAKPAKAKRL